MKALKKNDMGVSPVIAVILMVAITVVLAGVVFLWAQSFTEDADGGVETLNIKVAAYQDETNSAADKLEIEVLGGTIVWGDYTVKVDGVEWLLFDDGDGVAGNTKTTAGQTAVYYSDADGESGDFLKGESYKVQIINLEQNKVVFTNEDVIAKSY